MKSPLIVTLSIIGVLGTATAAMAVNSDTLGAINQGTIGRAAQVLVPAGATSATPTPEATPAPSPTAEATPAPSPTAEEVKDSSWSTGKDVSEPTPATEHVDATSRNDDSSVSTHDANKTEHSTERDD